MDIPGLPARKAALRLLDAVLRRGETLEAAGPSALQGIRSDADRALARALAGEALRWLIDLDGLIDSATRMTLPEDAKAALVAYSAGINAFFATTTQARTPRAGVTCHNAKSDACASNTRSCVFSSPRSSLLNTTCRLSGNQLW